jgi:hypothetical protein
MQILDSPLSLLFDKFAGFDQSLSPEGDSMEKRLQSRLKT